MCTAKNYHTCGTMIIIYINRTILAYRMRMAVHSDQHHIVDDQIGANKALDDMGVTWKQMNDDYYKGIVSSGNVTITITTLSLLVICRYPCNRELLTHYYTWHKYSKDKKSGALKKAKLSAYHIWMLKDNWDTALWNTSLIAKQWLLDITISLLSNIDGIIIQLL